MLWPKCGRNVFLWLTFYDFLSLTILAAVCLSHASLAAFVC